MASEPERGRRRRRLDPGSEEVYVNSAISAIARSERFMPEDACRLGGKKLYWRLRAFEEHRDRQGRATDARQFEISILSRRLQEAMGGDYFGVKVFMIGEAEIIVREGLTLNVERNIERIVEDVGYAQRLIKCARAIPDVGRPFAELLDPVEDARIILDLSARGGTEK